MAAQGIPINDLYSLGAEHPEYFADAVHYNAAGKAAQGALVAKAIATLLK
jgi:lysophospholipase L1-like esterase